VDAQGCEGAAVQAGMRRNRVELTTIPVAIPIMQLVCQLIVGLLKKLGYAGQLSA
jgi:ABC-type polysaccharide transport system permease subunit